MDTNQLNLTVRKSIEKLITNVLLLTDVMLCVMLREIYLPSVVYNFLISLLHKILSTYFSLGFDIASRVIMLYENILLYRSKCYSSFIIWRFLLVICVSRIYIILEKMPDDFS